MNKKAYSAMTAEEPLAERAPRSTKQVIVLVVALIIIVAVGWNALIWAGIVPSPDFPAVARGKWQAVFLTNNQVYFGHLQNYNQDYALLKDIYYLRVTELVNEPLQQGAPSQPAINLVKLGGELHGPQDVMYIPKDKVMFWENMKDDSQVVQAITNFLATQPQ
ncbi:MAG: hypothetical protein A3A43_00960 [Candidatus Liptonbacteria bacterium RIFCSPLOWO2_01_FULL_56_20]|uniref:Uncharacterized protein n=1 Tax=Candidatus Liptonbacteria bacterium RIFCSPLOWO2_01_FULL_56_20 TaxID=1798652 RepID=A0A1G2CMP9_9BACT|nr:MAG: hypothetical protein UY96_C0006G0004 [Parcubacteria group bacterium GW2011_GWB1_56_8]OGZ01728.1 MAG: hypothetical protein A3A43_00960 [Candidatus Liptonbacteria bacterium RIFCSPLOWO2_01_FULL_56_20]